MDARKPWKEEVLKDGEMPSKTLEQIIEDAFNRGYTMKQIEAELPRKIRRLQDEAKMDEQKRPTIKAEGADERQGKADEYLHV